MLEQVDESQHRASAEAVQASGSWGKVVWINADGKEQVKLLFCPETAWLPS